MILLQFIEFWVTFIEAITGIRFTTKMLGNEITKLGKVVIIGLFLAIIVWCINQYQIFSILATVIGILGITSAAHGLYKYKVKDSLILTSVYFLLVYVVDFLTLSMFCIFHQNERFVMRVTMGFSTERCWFLLISKSLLVLLSFLITDTFFQNKKVSEKKMWAGVMFFILLTGCLVRDTFLKADQNTLLLWLLFLLLILTALYAAAQYRENVKVELQMQAVSKHNALVSETYARIIQEYQKKQIFYHDQKNQYLIIYNLLINKEYEKAQEYMQKLDIINVETIHKWTNIASLDLLLDYKYQEARTNNISMEIVSVPLDLKIPDIDLIALFGNALDNAIEACFKMKKHKPWILVSIQKNNQMTFIKILNSCNEEPKKKGDAFLSSKETGRVQGLGLLSMNQIVKKYNGNMQIDYTENKFSIIFSFFE